MKKPQNNSLTNPMRRIVVGVLLTHIGYVALGFLLTLLLASFFVNLPQSTEDPRAKLYEEHVLAPFLTAEPSVAPEPSAAAVSESPPASAETPLEDGETEVNLAPYRNWTSLLTFVLFLLSVYNIGWQYGLRDRNVVKCGYAKEELRRGMFAGMFSQIPSAAVLLLVWVFAPMGIALSPWFEFLHYTYSWLFYATGSHMAVYALVLPAAPLILHFGFRNGYNDISLRRRIVYADPERKRKKKDRFQ